MDDIKLITERIKESIEVKNKLLTEFPQQISKVINQIIPRLKNGKKVIACGNGGSNSDAQHIVGELLVKFYKVRKPIPAITLETNPAVITAIGNDFGYEESFSRAAFALSEKDDVFIALSTSGNSPNILKAIETAKQKGAWVLGFSGDTGGKMASLCDEIFLVPSKNTPRIQEAHITIAHILCELIEEKLSS